MTYVDVSILGALACFFSLCGFVVSERNKITKIKPVLPTTFTKLCEKPYCESGFQAPFCIRMFYGRASTRTRHAWLIQAYSSFEARASPQIGNDLDVSSSYRRCQAVSKSGETSAMATPGAPVVTHARSSPRVDLITFHERVSVFVLMNRRGSIIYLSTTM